MSARAPVTLRRVLVLLVVTWEIMLDNWNTVSDGTQRSPRRLLPSSVAPLCSDSSLPQLPIVLPHTHTHTLAQYPIRLGFCVEQKVQYDSGNDATWERQGGRRT